MIPSRLPSVPDAQEIIDRAFREANKVQDFYKKDYLEKDKIKSIQKIQVMEAVIRSSLKRIFNGFPKLEDTSEFERNMLILLFDAKEYERALKRIKWTMNKISELSSEYIRKIKSARYPDQIDSLRKSCYGRFSSFIEDIQDALETLRNDRELIREIPYINPELPVAVIAGFPNVGKSTLISKLTNLEPDIANYPFTTKRINIGIMNMEKGRIQVLDVPGLLNRKNRNKIERKALIAIENVADIVIFIIDPTEECGYQILEQEKLLGEIRATKKKIVEVENKSDKMKRENARLKISSLTGEGIDKLRKVLEVELYGG